MAQTLETRLASGVPGLDQILGGGLLPRRTVLLKGSPGSGKTTLGLQMLVAGAAELEDPGILLSFEQSPEQLLEDAAGFNWPLKELIEQKKVGVMLVTPEEILSPTGRQESHVLLNIEDWVEDYKARRIMIDSMSHLTPLFTREDARAQFMAFIMGLKRLDLTPILTAEEADRSGLTGMDAYLVDTLIHIKFNSGGAGTGMGQRTLEVLKSRGTRSLAGRHPFEIGRNGIVIYPRAETESLTDKKAKLNLGATKIPSHDSQPVSSGVQGLDALLGGGYLPGSVIFVAGVSGTYKTTLLGQFLLGRRMDSSAKNEIGLWISFNETAAELDREFAARGLDLSAARESAGLRIMEVIPGAEPIEKILEQTEKLILQHGISKVGIDSPAELGQGIEPEQLEAFRWFLRRLRALGVTTLVTQRLARPTGANPLAEIAAPELADTIVYLGLVEIESRLEKVLSVIKHRGGPTGGELVGVQCGAHGLNVSERFVGLAGVLSGTALGKRKAQIEEIFQPLFFIRDFLAMARNPQLESSRRDAILANLTNEAGRLIGLLSKYFDQPLPDQKDKDDNREDKKESGK